MPTRLSIPSVNQNPQPPGTAHGIPLATNPNTLATSTAKPTNKLAGLTSQAGLLDPFKAAAQAQPSAAPAPFALPEYNGNGQPDPRDAAYWANVAKLKFSDEQEYGQGLREQQRSDTDYADALQTAIRSRAQQQRALGEDAIRGNLGASGWLNRNEGEQNTAYTQERAHAARNKEEEDQDRAARQKAIIEGFGIDAAGLLTDAGTRYTEGQERRAENEAPPVEAGAAASAGPSSSGNGKNNSGGGTNWAFYANPSDLKNGGKKKKSGGGNGNGGTTAPANPQSTAIYAAANASKPKKKKGK